ncbi:LOW QUALITY PROTEIN: hypothetical protein HJC23_013473 [Cyclotella cryptica]|uniref:LAGLIDADG homing endonuclease n=1 Tax=Cyclotella cryptica TaxID=29204 RepID=A0ABD3QCY0_9STRA
MLTTDGTLLMLSMERCCSDKEYDHGSILIPSLVTIFLTINVASKISLQLCIWKNMKIFNNPIAYFAPFEYLITDTAYEPTWLCIPTYKCTGGNH